MYSKQLGDEENGPSFFFLEHVTSRTSLWHGSNFVAVALPGRGSVISPSTQAVKRTWGPVAMLCCVQRTARIRGVSIKIQKSVLESWQAFDSLFRKAYTCVLPCYAIVYCDAGRVSLNCTCFSTISRYSGHSLDVPRVRGTLVAWFRCLTSMKFGSLFLYCLLNGLER